MEHRLSKRTDGKLGVLVCKRGMPVATGQVRDASNRGLFIATDYNDVQLNQILDLEFGFPDKQEKQFRRLKGLVVRKSENGIGVDFDGVENDSFTILSLIEWLKQHHRSTSHFPVRKQA
ncbi:PilZ domain-containing protein [Marinobacter orientalis]|uniref:PilZ domain-containing protein n=1 Tax=Marinobacter orientalis TaxID=1928859 RepID=A0A7Y0NL63_9GAMM|nr:PilZ domain-containing protein [Marinobacter orientalis]NMT62766.1 PilZ domain-containing protein [Marinobacter orientalis]TGX51446.1 PilZ domain-containing protein [Marinobacter orientalis]